MEEDKDGFPPEARGNDIDDEATAFPASDNTPGQAESRSAYDVFAAELEQCPWRKDYVQLRAEGWDWRKAAYIAWASSPAKERKPETQAELATTVLGLKSARTIQKWRENDPRIDERVAQLQVEPLLRHRADVINALVDVASRADANAHADRKLYLEMVGDYRPKMGLTGPNGGPIQTLNATDLAGLSDEELDQLIANLEAISRATGSAAAGQGADRTGAADGDGQSGQTHGSAPTVSAPADVDDAAPADADSGPAA